MAGERVFKVQILGNADGAIAAFKKLGREGQESFEKIQSIGSTLGSAFDFVKKGAFVALGALTAIAGAATAAVYAAAAALAISTPFFATSKTSPSASEPSRPSFLNAVMAPSALPRIFTTNVRSPAMVTQFYSVSEHPFAQVSPLALHVTMNLLLCHAIVL